MIALSPEPQTRLMVVADVVLGSPASQRRLPGRGLARAGLQDLAHQDLVDPGGGGVETGALDGGPMATPPSSTAGTCSARHRTSRSAFVPR